MIFLSRLLSLVLASLLVQAPIGAQPPVQTLQLHLMQPSAPAAIDPRDLIVQVTDSTGAAVSDAAITFHLPDDGATGVFADGSRAATVTSDAAGQAHIGGVRWGVPSGTVVLRITASKGSSHAGIIAELKLPPLVVAKSEVVAIPAPALAATPKPIPTLPKSPAVQIVSNSAPAARPIKPGPVLLTQASDADNDPHKGEPRVSISTNTPASGAESLPSQGSKKKWIILAVVAAGAAGGAVAFLGKSKTATPTTTASGPTIGAPSISIGLP